MNNQILDADGKWVDGKAAPELLREDLRQLPGDVVTKDADDPDRIFESDAPHIVSSLTKEHAKAEEKGKKAKPEDTRAELKKAWAPGPGEHAPVRQWFVDVVRMRVISAMIETEMRAVAAGDEPDLSVRHLWFPENNVNRYELRQGNPPGNRHRPKWMRNIRIELDLLSPPQSMIDFLKERGVALPSLRDTFERSKAARAAGLVMPGLAPGLIQ